MILLCLTTCPQSSGFGSRISTPRNAERPEQTRLPSGYGIASVAFCSLVDRLGIRFIVSPPAASWPVSEFGLPMVSTRCKSCLHVVSKTP